MFHFQFYELNANYKDIIFLFRSAGNIQMFSCAGGKFIGSIHVKESFLLA